ncbi:DUF6257 family protein [Streptomyces sp. FL07-04A]|uniref:DUF6257 family protein n=1 Tax=Streptomyces sp. FL07-04A TaxID=3028658 RepID=UPI0029ABEA78|nr:DUF6257 family protein [Streptomyces sp. FL07-04A]MDX3578647.1 DUF6257 family protein [Streptomyces sp. FL07-04A]
MANSIEFSDFTASEKVRIVALTARMAKRGLADDGSDRVDTSDLKRRIERIEDAALRRKQKK